MSICKTKIDAAKQSFNIKIIYIILIFYIRSLLKYWIEKKYY